MATTSYLKFNSTLFAAKSQKTHRHLGSKRNVKTNEQTNEQSLEGYPIHDLPLQVFPSHLLFFFSSMRLRRHLKRPQVDFFARKLPKTFHEIPSAIQVTGSMIFNIFFHALLVGGFFPTHNVQKYARQIGKIFPNFRGRK